MTELTKARLKLDNLKPAEPLELEGYSNIFRQSGTRARARARAPVSKIQKSEKSSSKVLKNVIDTLDETIKGLDKPSGPVFGERFNILAQELEIKICTIILIT